MARSLTEIYATSKRIRDQYLELTEFKNSSKMSVLDAFTWVVASSIMVFETIMDTFKVDLAKELQNRINGTPAYYANALLKYQSGDNLVINDEGTAFSYNTINEEKRIITKVSYSEYSSIGFSENVSLMKIATGVPGAYRQIEEDELLAVRAYVDQIKFAGTNIHVVSRLGDVLIPRVTVYYDGAVSEDEVYKNIENELNNFIEKVNFDGAVYVQKIIDAMQKAEHVLDVHFNTESSDQQGIFVAQYDDDNLLIPSGSGDFEKRVDRLFYPNSGFIKQSSKTGAEASLQTWRETIVLKIEEK